MSFYLFEIGFLPIRIWDILDILIVGYLMYQIYKLLRGSIAFNIFIGVIFIFVLWWLVGVLKMDLLSSVLSQFVSVGVLMLLIIFQPEVRRFLLILGNNTLKQRSNFLSSILDSSRNIKEGDKQQHIQEIKKAIMSMSRTKTGALIVFTSNLNLEVFSNSGVPINGMISQMLLESIFNKESPLHDGAVIIANGKIVSASSVLPLSASQGLPQAAGLRHRAAVGVSENTTVAAFVVSEENGTIAVAYEGKLKGNLDESTLAKKLMEYYE